MKPLIDQCEWKEKLQIMETNIKTIALNVSFSPSN